MTTEVMTNPIELEVRFYGSFRRFGDGHGLRLKLSPGAGLAELRFALARRLRELHPTAADDATALIGESAFADDAQVLDEAHRFERGGTVSVLPPVCGG